VIFNFVSHKKAVYLQNKILKGMNLYNDVYQLLSDNDCVIIPDFGGFVANYYEARVDLRNQEFCPPARKIAFNESLKNNDGLLVNHICQNTNVNWATANEYVSRFVTEINDSLKDNQTLTFENLGKFTRKSGSLVFVPFEGLNLLESSYGLGSFHFPMLKPANAFIEIQKPQTLSKTKSAKANKPVKSRKSLIYAVSAAAVITGLVVISVQFGWLDLKTGNTGNNNNYANINPVETLANTGKETVKPEKTVAPVITDENTQDKVTENITEPDKEEIAPVAENTTVVKPVSENNFSAKSYVIAGSFSNIENADNLQKSLASIGLPSQVLPVSNGMYRVSVKSYADSGQAVSELTGLREQTGNPSLWILNL